MPDTNGITRTLSARYHKDGSEILIRQGKKAPRRLTPTECARLMGFPEAPIVVSDTQAYRQFGNAVIVPAIQAVAEKAVAALLKKCGQCTKTRNDARVKAHDFPAVRKGRPVGAAKR